MGIPAEPCGEAVVPLLGKFMPLEIATKLFLSIAVAMWVLGPVAIQRALFGRIGLGGMLAAAFAYNAQLHLGLLQLLFCRRLELHGASPPGLRRDGVRNPLYLGGFALAFTLLYFCAPLRAATMLLLIGCFELSRAWRGRNFSVPQLGAALCHYSHCSVLRHSFSFCS